MNQNKTIKFGVRRHVVKKSEKENHMQTDTNRSIKVTLLHNTPLNVCSKAIRTCWNSHDKSDSDKEYCGSCKADITDTFRVSYPDGMGTCPACGEPTYADYVETGDKDRELIDRVGNKMKHASTLEHLTYTFYISGISRALLQELSRHRMASLSVKSTRYTLKELRDEEPFCWVSTKEESDNLEIATACDLAGVDWTVAEDVHERADKYIVNTDDRPTNLASLKALENLRLILVNGTSNDKAKYCLPESYKTELTWTINARSLQNFISLRTDKSALWEIQDLAKEVYNKLPEDHQYLFSESIK
jgi:thymidylate synthase (FAD)